MKIAILGNGSLGRSLGNLLASRGATVFLGARAHEEMDYEEGIVPSTVLEACSEAELVATALPWSVGNELVSLEVLKRLPLAGKTVIDMTNPLGADWSPLDLGSRNSAGEETARALPSSHVVKAFNTIFADSMNTEVIQSFESKPAGFFCGDEQGAKDVVGELMKLAGFNPIDVGELSSARFLEQMAHLNIRLAVGQGGGTKAAFGYLRSQS